MKLIIISDNGSYHKKINFGWKSLTILMLSLGLLLAYIYSNFKASKNEVITKSEIQVLKKFDSLLLKTAKLEAQVEHLNSLGKSIAKKSNVDIEAFLLTQKLTQKPTMGGLEENIMNDLSFSSEIFTQENFVSSLEDIEYELGLHEQRFDTMESSHSALKIAKFKQHATQLLSAIPVYYSPVATGYVSSTFGKRRDPINGHQRHHNGIDIAAKHGSKIHTIASGFVTFSGRKGGYGNVIDIHHSASLKSRYAHLDSIKVKRGDVVRKGDTIATMGRTGRATGSHLHLEVWKNDRPVNPESYIDTALIK